MASVLAISGSLRRASHNTGLLRAAAESAPDGVSITLYDGLSLIPAYNEDIEAHPGPEVDALRAAIREADAVLFATPEYNGQIPGHLKQVVDWGSRPRGEDAVLFGKPVAVISTSKAPYGALWAAESLRKTLSIAGARVVEEAQLPVGTSDEKFDSDGTLTDPQTRSRLSEIVGVLLQQLAQTA